MCSSKFNIYYIFLTIIILTNFSFAQPKVVKAVYLNTEITEQVRDSKVNVSLKTVDILVREVNTLIKEIQKPGNYEVKFISEGLASGLYFYKLQAGSFVDVKKMIFLK